LFLPIGFKLERRSLEGKRVKTEPLLEIRNCNDAADFGEKGDGHFFGRAHSEPRMERVPRLRKTSRVLLAALLATIWLLAMIGLGVLSGLGWPLAFGLSLILVVYAFRVRSVRRLVPMVGGVFFVALVWFLLLSPSNDLDWEMEYSKLPEIEVDGSTVNVKSLRNFDWHGATEFDSKWEERSFDLDRLNSVELMVEPFGDSELVAHVMLGFGFEGGERVIVSAEARKQVGEQYGLIAGALRQFELMYVFGSEEDILRLRAIHFESRLFVYPIKANRKFMQKLFVDLCGSANELLEKPQFYATFRRNCATTLLDHINQVHVEKIGSRSEKLFSAQAGKLLYELGYMDTELSFEEAREHFQIDEKIRQYADDPRFSEKIRE
jgi:hypothetical protein